MKRYLTVGIISGILMVIVVAFSWFTFPGWQNPASGGFWALLGATVVGVVVFVQSLVSIWKDLKEEDKEKIESKSALKNVELNIGENVDKSNVFVGDKNVINNYFPIVEKNIEKNEPDFWNLKHPYPMPPNFTGRIAERALLTQWLNDDSENRLFILRALGGFGKSALTWHWLTHDVDPKVWKKVIFWSFYEGDSSFESFVKETLEYLKIEVPQGGRPQVDELLKALQKEKVLLIMDGFERALRAYSSMNAAYQGDEEPKIEENQFDCVNLNAEIFLKSICSFPNIKSKALMTTRLTPRAIKPRGEFMLGCKEIELAAMQKEDAVEFFKKQGIKGNHSEIESACAPYGYHPLSLRILAGYILKDFENPADIAVAQKLKIDGDIIQQKNHVMKVAYDTLSPDRQKLLSTIACFRSPVELKTLKAIVENEKILNYDLQDLIKRGLLHFDGKNKYFDLHPIVRRFAYERLTANDRTGAHERIVNYFEAIPKPEKVEKLEDLAPVIELYHHMAQAGNLDEAYNLFHSRLSNILHFQFGAYQTIVELLLALFSEGEDKLLRLQQENTQALALNMLGIAYNLSGYPYRAKPLIEMQIAIREKQDIKKSIAIGYGNLGSVNLNLGSLKNAKSNIQHRIDLCKEINDSYFEGAGHAELGRLLIYIGWYDDAETEFTKAIELFEITKDIQYIGIVWSYRTLLHLNMLRIKSKSKELILEMVTQSASTALSLADQDTKERYTHPRDYIRIYLLFGMAYRMNSKLTLAGESLSKGLNLCRQINNVEQESDILLELARLHYDQENYQEAKSLADEALTITERCGYVLQGADVNLFLSQYALEQEKDKVKAKEYAQTALKLATCDGPPYYYKVAYHEAEAMLEKISKLK